MTRPLLIQHCATLVACAALLTGCTITTSSYNETKTSAYESPSDPIAYTPRVSTESPIIEEGVALRVGEKLIIEFSGIPRTEEKEFVRVVGPRGTIQLPYIGKVPIEGLTAASAASVVQQKMRNGIFNNIVVTILVSDPVFFIFGEVHMKGEISISRPLNLLEAIAKAGGPTTFFSGKIEIIRNGSVESFRMKEIRENRVLPPVIHPKDIIRLLD